MAGGTNGRWHEWQAVSNWRYSVPASFCERSRIRVVTGASVAVVDGQTFSRFDGSVSGGIASRDGASRDGASRDIACARLAKLGAGR